LTTVTPFPTHIFADERIHVGVDIPVNFLQGIKEMNWKSQTVRGRSLKSVQVSHASQRLFFLGIKNWQQKCALLLPIFGGHKSERTS